MLKVDSQPHLHLVIPYSNVQQGFVIPWSRVQQGPVINKIFNKVHNNFHYQSQMHPEDIIRELPNPDAKSSDKELESAVIGENVIFPQIACKNRHFFVFSSS